MRNSTYYLGFLTLCMALLAFLLLVHPHLNANYFENSVRQKQQLVKMLGLTDMCLFTEARYTRHLSQADHFAAFQDSPMAFEHFPSGSLTLPLLLLRK
jgi:hypothetical protein